MGSEWDIIVPAGSVSRVEWANSIYQDQMQLNYHQVGDTLRIAMASAKPIGQAGDLGAIRLIHSDEWNPEQDGQLSDRIRFQKAMVNEVDITEYVNEEFTTDEAALTLPAQFALHQNYPNPFNPVTNINYELPVNAKVSVQVFNMLGQQVQTLVNDNQKAGRYTLRWDAAGFSSGTYLLRIDVLGDDNQQYSQIRKMLLIK